MTAGIGASFWTNIQEGMNRQRDGQTKRWTDRQIIWNGYLIFKNMVEFNLGATNSMSMSS